jgi:perosamine synthetase
MMVPAQEIAIDPADRASILAEIDRLLSAGRLSGDVNVERFEEEFARYVGTRYAVAVSTGTAALELTLLAIGVRDRTVVVPANTNFATFVAAWRCGARVVLCDVDPRTLAPRLADVAAVATPDTAAVLLVHMGGIIAASTVEIAAWCEGNGITLVEDAAHAHGSRRDGRHAGTFGRAGAFSFFATKVMTTGEGGIVVTDDPTLTEELRLYRNLGKGSAWVSQHTRMGTNGRMTELAAVVGRHQLARLDEFVSARRHVAQRYADLLAEVPGLTLLDPGHPYSGYKVVALLPDHVDRTSLKERVAADGVHLAGEVYAMPLHHQPVLDQYQHLRMPGSEFSCARQICLPVYPTLDDARVDRVAELLVKQLAIVASRP